MKSRPDFPKLFSYDSLLWCNNLEDLQYALLDNNNCMKKILFLIANYEKLLDDHNYLISFFRLISEEKDKRVSPLNMFDEIKLNPVIFGLANFKAVKLLTLGVNFNRKIMSELKVFFT